MLVGCASPSRLAAVPDQNYTDAIVPGMEEVRYFIAEDTSLFLEHGIHSVQREKSHLIAAYENEQQLPPANFLAISGGGDQGAFGAGLLVGWSKTGKRPEFKAVTGISTGALTAPFAFLGEEYDDQLREVYTEVSPDKIMRVRALIDIVFGDSAADNSPLWKLVRKYCDEEMLRAIAAEYDKGRLLLIATTNLDAQRPVVWNIGEIAKSQHPSALELFRSVLIASAAIPGAFPPVMIDVDVNGTAYQEMHVDGGAMSQAFIYPPSINLEQVAAERGVRRERILYVIRNARLDPAGANVERRTLSIAGRAISTLIQTQGIGDLYKIYLSTQRDGINYNLAYIPATFDAEHTEEFDTVYMNKLFDLGFELAAGEFRWEKYPPGFIPDD